MSVDLKKLFLFLAEQTGAYRLSRKHFADKLHILCYHGFSYGDQSSFRPKLFIEEETFKARIEYLVKNNFRFLSLSEFDDYLKGRLVCKNPVLLTIDDGWKGTHEIALPILKKYGIPHVIYLYTDCFVRGVPVVNVLLQYALWKTRHRTVEWNSSSYDLSSVDSRNELLRQLLLETKELSVLQLNLALKRIFDALGLDYVKEREWENFRLINEAEIKDHLANGGTFQLHTHHHVNPLQDDLLKAELLENQRIIESVTGQKAEHFCYPSGEYSPAQFPLLREMEIKSAVTCRPGLNRSATQPYELMRFLDGENISQGEFEAEMNGFMEVARKLRKR